MRKNVFRSSLGLGLLVLVGLSGPAVGQNPRKPPQGAPAAPAGKAFAELPSVGQPLERDLKEGEAQVFTTRLGAGEYFEITVEQLGGDVVIEVRLSTGKSFFKIDSVADTREPETVGFVADRTGSYQVAVRRSSRKSAPKEGRYRLTVTGRRAATTRDRSLDKGLRALSEAFAGSEGEKRLKLCETAYLTLSPLLGAGHPNVRAAALAYAGWVSNPEEARRAVEFVEPILAIREKDGTATPTELLQWIGVLIQGYGGNSMGDEICRSRARLASLFPRALKLTETVNGLESEKNDQLIGSFAMFLSHCEPERFPGFMEDLIASREAVLGHDHPVVGRLLKIYASGMTNERVSRFGAYIEQEVAVVVADSTGDPRRRMKSLSGLAKTLFSAAFAVWEYGPRPNESEEKARVRFNTARVLKERGRKVLEQALAIGEPEKAAMQGEYLTCLKRFEPGNDYMAAPPWFADRMIAFAESIETLETPELLRELIEIAHSLQYDLDPLARNGCSTDAVDLGPKREKVRRVYELVLRLGVSALKAQKANPPVRVKPSPSGETGSEEGDEAEAPVKEQKQRIESLDDEVFRYAAFLMETDPAAAEAVLNRGLTIGLEFNEDRIGTVLVFAGGFDLAGNERRAETMYAEALAMAEALPDEAERLEGLESCLTARAQFFERQGRYDEAGAEYKRLVGVLDRLRRLPVSKEFEENTFAEALEGMTWLAAVRGDRAAFDNGRRTLAQRFPDLFDERASDSGSLRKREEALKSPRRWAQNLLCYYALQYACFGNRERAGALVERLIGATENQPEEQVSLRLAAGILIHIGQDREAIPLLERAMRIRTSPDAAEPMTVLPMVLHICDTSGLHDRAIGILEEAAAILEKQPGTTFILKYVLSQLAYRKEMNGRPDEALRIYERLIALGIGDESLPVMVQDHAMAELWRAGQPEAAFRFLRQGNEQREQRFRQHVIAHLFLTRSFLSVSSEKELRDGCTGNDGTDRQIDFSQELYLTVSFQTASPTSQTTRTALESVLRRKNRRLDEWMNEAGLKAGVFKAENLEFGAEVDDFPEGMYWSPWGRRDVTTLMGLFADNEDLPGRTDRIDGRFFLFCPRSIPFDRGASQPVIVRESYQRSGAALKDVLGKTTAALIAKQPDLTSILTPITLEAVQKALPADGALVEVVRYAPFNPKTGTTEGEERYAVYVLTPQGEPKWFDGGTASEIDAAANLLANEARDYADEESKAATTVLENRFIAPALKLTGNAKRVYVAFDERLALLPLRKLVNVDGKPFGESRGLIFIRSGRELLTMNTPR